MSNSSHLLDTELSKKTKKKKAHWSGTFAVAGGMLGGAACILLWLGSRVILPTWAFWLSIIGIGVIAGLAQWKYFNSERFQEKYGTPHWLMYGAYNIGGIGFSSMALFLMLNWMGASSNVIEEKHTIVGRDSEYYCAPGVLCVYELQGGAYSGFPEARAGIFTSIKKKEGEEDKALYVYYREGLLGLKLLMETSYEPLGSSPEIEIIRP